MSEEDIWKKEKAALNKFADFTNKYALTIGLTLTIIGFFVIGISWVYLRGEGSYWYEWQKEITRNFGFLQPPLMLTAFSSLIVGFALIGLHLHRHPYPTCK
jgi:hypothetical protein